RAADPATRVVRVFVAPDEEAVGALGDLEPVALDARERLERRARRCAAVRAMAIGRVAEGVRHLVADGAALAFPAERSRFRRHGPPLTALVSSSTAREPRTDRRDDYQAAARDGRIKRWTSPASTLTNGRGVGRSYRTRSPTTLSKHFRRSFASSPRCCAQAATTSRSP